MSILKSKWQPLGVASLIQLRKDNVLSEAEFEVLKALRREMSDAEQRLQQTDTLDAIQEEVMSSKDVAAFIQASERTAAKLMSEPNFPLIDPTKQRHRRVLKSDLITYLKTKSCRGI